MILFLRVHLGIEVVLFSLSNGVSIIGQNHELFLTKCFQRQMLVSAWKTLAAIPRPVQKKGSLCHFEVDTCIWEAAMNKLYNWSMWKGISQSKESCGPVFSWYMLVGNGLGESKSYMYVLTMMTVLVVWFAIKLARDWIQLICVHFFINTPVD